MNEKKTTPEAAFFGGTNTNTVTYRDGNFECQVTSSDTKFVSETLDNFFNEQGVAKQLEDILSGVEIPPAIKEKLDQVFAAIKSNKDKAAAAINKNS